MKNNIYNMKKKRNKYSHYFRNEFVSTLQEEKTVSIRELTSGRPCCGR